MDKQIVLATVWVTIWNSYCKKMYIDTVRNFAGDEYYFDALKHLQSKASNLGYSVKVGRKYISLVKGV
mgnify:CR=1 FL=1